MIKCLSQQSDCARHAHKNENADTVNFTSQIASLICTATFTKRVKSDATIFKLRCSRTVVCYRFYRMEALPLVSTRFLRLAHSSLKAARIPARRSRDGRETPGKKSGEMSRVIFVQRPGNGRTVAAVMSPSVRQDDSQDNLPCAGFGRAMSAPEACETTRNTSAQWSRTTNATSHKQLVEFLVVSFNQDIQNYEHTNHTNARS